jgi:hypothetical protein
MISNQIVENFCAVWGAMAPVAQAVDMPCLFGYLYASTARL